MKTQKSRIDELVNQKEKLLFKKQKNEDKTNEVNSKLGTKINKLENKAYRNRVQKEDKNALIDRELKRIRKLIELEREYVNSLVVQENKPKTIKQ